MPLPISLLQKNMLEIKSHQKFFRKFESDFLSVLPPLHTAKSLNNTKLRVNMWSKRGLKKTNQRVENRSFWREFREIYSKKLDIGVITQHDRYTEIKKKKKNFKKSKFRTQFYGDISSTKGGKPLSNRSGAHLSD